MIVGAGQTGAGSMDAGNMLKPQLNRRKIKRLVLLQMMNIDLGLRKKRH